MNKQIDIVRCNTCGCRFGSDGVYHQAGSNRQWLATLDDDGNVAQECCEACAQELQEDQEW